MHIYTKEILEQVVKDSTNISEVVRKLGLNLNQSSHGLISSKIKFFNINTDHFTIQRQKIGPKRSNDEILKYRDSASRERSRALKKALIDNNVKYECSLCQNNGKWREYDLTLQIDHIDGDYRNNNKENLRFLCPNCHSQTETYCQSKGRTKKLQYKSGNKKCVDCDKIIADVSTRCSKCFGYFNKQKTKRPEKHVLENLLKTKSCPTIAKEYMVSVTSVREWCKKYGLEYKSKSKTKKLSKSVLISELLKFGFKRLAKKLNVDRSTVKYWCETYNIPTTIVEIKKQFAGS
jgi:hypothetical protein